MRAAAREANSRPVKRGTIVCANKMPTRWPQRKRRLAGHISFQKGEDWVSLKFISWNVNGLRACLDKGFLDFFKQADADVFCVQETKMQPGQAELSLPGYEQFWNSAEKKGYSGTAVFTRIPPLSVSYDIGREEHQGEGRVITLEFPDFFLVNVYTPNAQRELARLDYRMQWEDAFRSYLVKLDREKPVILCGDLNVAHQEIDLKNPKSNRQNAGFSQEERGKFYGVAASWFCGLLPAALSRRHGSLYLVVLYVSGQSEECWLAD